MPIPDRKFNIARCLNKKIGQTKNCYAWWSSACLLVTPTPFHKPNSHSTFHTYAVTSRGNSLCLHSIHLMNSWRIFVPRWRLRNEWKKANATRSHWSPANTETFSGLRYLHFYFSNFSFSERIFSFRGKALEQVIVAGIWSDKFKYFLDFSRVVRETECVFYASVISPNQQQMTLAGLWVGWNADFYRTLPGPYQKSYLF